jgi:hypothetical protein
MLAGWYAGLWPAFVATIPGAVMSVTYIVPPFGHFQFNTPADAFRFGLFLLVGSS